MIAELTKTQWLNILGITEAQIPNLLILSGTRSLKRHCDMYRRPFTHIRHLTLDGFLHDAFVGRLNGRTVGYAGVYGAAMAADVVHLFGLLGTRMVLQTGCCRPLVDKIAPGDLFIATEAYAGAGVAPYYPPRREVVSAQFYGLELAVFQQITGRIVHWGRVYSSAAPLMRPKHPPSPWYGKGCWVFDRQTAATYAVAQYFGMARAAILAVAASPIPRPDHTPYGPDLACERDLLEISLKIARACSAELAAPPPQSPPADLVRNLLDRVLEDDRIPRSAGEVC